MHIHAKKSKAKRFSDPPLRRKLWGIVVQFPLAVPQSERVVVRPSVYFTAHRVAVKRDCSGGRVKDKHVAHGPARDVVLA